MAEESDGQNPLPYNSTSEDVNITSGENPRALDKKDAGPREDTSVNQTPVQEIENRKADVESEGEPKWSDNGSLEPTQIPAQTQNSDLGKTVAQTEDPLGRNSSILEEERPILSQFPTSLTLEERTNSRKLNLEENHYAVNSDLADSLSPPYSVLESSEHTSPASSVVTDSSPNELPDNDDLTTASQLMGMQQQRRAGAAAVLSNAEATGTLGKSGRSKEALAASSGSFDHGVVSREGEMVSFVADDLMTKIRKSTSSASTSPANSNRDVSPTTASMSSSSSRFSMRSSSIGSSSAIPPIDPTALADLERQCKRVSDSLDLMFGHLAGTLHNMSAITVGHTQTYRDAVEKAGVTADQCVRSMYALMAKCEELQNSMQVTKELSNQIKSIKRQLDELETLCK